MSRIQPFLNIRTEGALLPSDLLSRLVEGTNLTGLKPEDYHLGAGEKLNEAISRSWTRLLSLWSGFRKAQTSLSASDLGTTLTRERWLLHLFQELGYGRLIVASPVEIDGKTYPISHVWQGQYYQVPIHLVSFRADLDKRSEQRIQGASKASPHGMVQEYLNRSEHHLWALASNGLKLLILRDNASLTRQAYVEFDLEGIFDGEAYADFRLLWMLCHQSRLEGSAQDRPETCWLEVWSRQAETEGRRALDQLRIGVQKALENLGTGFIANAANQNLRDRLQAGQLQKQDLYRQLLRLVYRLIFLFVAEDRDLLHFPGASEDARSRYARFYSGQRLRKMAERTRGSRHADLWVALRLVFGKLGDDGGCSQLGLPALGGFLFGPEAMPDLEAAALSNEHLLQAIRNLGLVKDHSGWRLVDYRNLGSEELGSIYESLLELNPTMELDAGIFSLGSVAGNQRKTSGSYYTPDSLVQSLLDSALDPVVEEAIRGKSPAEAERAILTLKVCDPAVGSGHFLVGAAHRLANHLARVRAVAQGESEPSPLFHQQALRDVIGRCLYGVDMNPMAAELCRVSLWLEAIEPGKPLSFLDHHIRVGNSLLGATPALLAKGIPDEAFTPIEGDDKEVCSRFKKVNKEERNQQTRLFAATTEPWEQLGNLAASMVQLDAAPDDSIEAIRSKERMYEELVRSGNYLDGRFLADTWCAAFAWKKTREFNYPITEEVFRRIERNPHTCDGWMRTEIERLAEQNQFFHWHLAFPDVFHQPAVGQAAENEQTGWNGGFQVVLGNPPWERVTIRDKEWFADRASAISDAGNARSRGIALMELKESDPELYRLFEDEKRRAAVEKLLFRESGLYPLCGCGDVNLFALFAEKAQTLLSKYGSSGLILPTGIATTKTTAPFFEHLATQRKIVEILDFDNRGGAFPAVQGNVRFCLLTTSAFGEHATFRAGSFLFSIEDLGIPGKLYELSLDDLQAINPNTVGCPMFASARDAELVKFVYRTVPILTHNDTTKSPWRVDLGRMFHMGDDAHLFWTYERLMDAGCTLMGNSFANESTLFLPLYESKLAFQFNHRAATFQGIPPEKRFGTHPATSDVLTSDLRDPTFCVLPRYWMSSIEAELKLGYRQGLLSFRNAISATADSRSLVAAILPRCPAGDSLKFIFSEGGSQEELFLAGCLNSLVVDYVLRQKASGGNASLFIIEQLPIIKVHDEEHISWESKRLLELTYTAWDLEGFAQDCGSSGPPFRWADERRFLLRCELDAHFFHLYLRANPSGEWQLVDRETPEDLARLKVSFATPREAVAYIIDTFPIVKRMDEELYGEYRTKRVILEIYDAMAESTRTGIPYETRLAPPPADSSIRQPKKNIGILAFGSLITDPGIELQRKIVMRIKTRTPFPAEYGRFSGKTRGGAPTLVPHESGAPVSAEILVLEDDISVTEATNMLWRRERRHEGTGETYVRGTSENSVLVEEFLDHPCVTSVLYTDFNSDGKIAHPTATNLAKRAIESVAKSSEGMDGITYLMNAIASGIETPLTADYKAEILKQTLTLTLEEALKTVRETR